MMIVRRRLSSAALWLCVFLYSILVVGGDSRARTGALSDKAFQVRPGPRTHSGFSWSTARCARLLPSRAHGALRRALGVSGSVCTAEMVEQRARVTP